MREAREGSSVKAENPEARQDSPGYRGRCRSGSRVVGCAQIECSWRSWREDAIHRRPNLEKRTVLVCMFLYVFLEGFRGGVMDLPLAPRPLTYFCFFSAGLRIW